MAHTVKKIIIKNHSVTFIESTINSVCFYFLLFFFGINIDSKGSEKSKIILN